MIEPQHAAIAALAGEAVVRALPMHGGDLSWVSEVRLASGRTLVAKTGPRVGAEARMLRAIRAAGCAAPAVVGFSETLLLMEHLHEGGSAWASLGENLRRLHGATGEAYGWPEDYAFGPVAIPGAATGTWPEFWATRRLLAAPGALPGDLRARVEHLAGRLPDLLPAHPRPALLHGDLWGGNVLHGRDGTAYVIDPACCHGDPEVDLAMLHLFGGPGPGFAESYGALPEGWQARRPVYQLWPALVHLRLFGPGYRGMVENLLSAAGS